MGFLRIAIDLLLDPLPELRIHIDLPFQRLIGFWRQSALLHHLRGLLLKDFLNLFERNASRHFVFSPLAKLGEPALDRKSVV